ncbi:MAG: aromatic amino acid lyase [Intrasporangium sp.]|uniref:aromatic amino acid lyase n=1 Tax=Intrasporangium sp. TaxID=1925024 RepID=UPI00264A345E|nr:aromatic amino acid lyase [Intrasporangium sp.]MDN5794921.1 aromatic amino acid lyase [Intrasporangium sp.]
MIDLDGRSLTLDRVEAVASGARCRMEPAAVARMTAAAAAMATAARAGRVYGRTTGVGANRDQDPSLTDRPGTALLRSHAGGWGPEVAPGAVRALSAIRANQLLVGASGAGPALAAALVQLANGADGNLPVVHAYGSVGTADLSALATVGLTLLGERPRRDGRVSGMTGWHDGDALPLISSSALTLALAALGTVVLQRLSQHAMVVYALTHVALGGNREAVGPVVDMVSPFPEVRRVAATVRGLLAVVPAADAPVQDFFGLRCYPQVHGPLLAELDRLRTGLESLVNAGSENPAVISTDPPTVAHHGGFHLAPLALRLDATAIALTASARSSLSRLSHLLTDAGYELPRFLGDRPGANGLLILEYSAASAVERLRTIAASPALLGTAHLSAGIEDDASQASHAATRLDEAVTAYRHVLACELLAATTALHARGMPLDGPLAVVWPRVAGLGSTRADHDTSDDLATAHALLDDDTVWR